MQNSEQPWNAYFRLLTFKTYINSVSDSCGDTQGKETKGHPESYWLKTQTLTPKPRCQYQPASLVKFKEETFVAQISP